MEKMGSLNEGIKNQLSTISLLHASHFYFPISRGALSLERPLLHGPQPQISHPGKRKRQLKPHIPPKHRTPNLLSHGPNEPLLCHAHDGSEDAEAECEHGGDTGREEGGRVEGGDVVCAALEEKVLEEGDSFVDGEPVALGFDY